MGDPHRNDRYGETWPRHRLEAFEAELRPLRAEVVLSGGWAWHFMSPPGHAELKHAHDHKDVDLFVEPERVASVVATLKGRGFERAWTRYDRLPSDEQFRRYEKTLLVTGHPPFKMVVDVFVRRVPSIEVNGWHVAEPRFLLALYRDVQNTDKCFAVKAAARLLAEGIDPVGRDELMRPG